MGKNTNSLVKGNGRKISKKNKTKKTKVFWTSGETKEGPSFVVKEALLRNWLIDQGYRRSNDYRIYHIVNGNTKQRDRNYIFTHAIEYVADKCKSMGKHPGNELMTCALRQCEDILLKRIGLLLSLPKINIEHIENGKV